MNKNSQPTFYWYDYETFGTHPGLDRASQFAGVRTDLDLNILGDEQLLYCNPCDDYLPDPDACAITGITPTSVAENGQPEIEFITRIQEAVSQPGTCNTGYNNIRFDDEFTRSLLFRNLFDPYEHEWKNGNTRWDLLDVVRLTRALRPEGINWPFHDNGSPSNRLEDLTAANGLQHSHAHDALSDVHATIAVARLIKQAQPRLFAFAFDHRTKQQVNALLNLQSLSPIVHVSGMISSEFMHTAVVLPVARHPTNKNGVIVYDLREDPTELLNLPAEDIRERVFTPADELGEGKTRIPLKTIHANRAPVVAPLSVLDENSAARCRIDIDVSHRHREKLLQCSDLSERIQQAMQGPGFGEPVDVDTSIYTGFFSNADRQTLQSLRELPADDLATHQYWHEDARIPEMLFRFRARNYPSTLSANEQTRWLEHCREQLTEDLGGFSRLERFDRKMANWEGNTSLKAELIRYRDELTARIGL